MTRIICGAAFAAAMSLACTPALAANGPMTPLAPLAGADTQVVEVHFDDLNLASEHGLQTLDRRIANAAHKVCSVDNSAELSLQNQSRACFRRTMAAADAARTRALAMGQRTTTVAAR